jgi:long-subunit acyl-CoA synthetase (AMP-forming)
VPEASAARVLDETIPGAVMASIAARPEADAVVEGFGEPERRVTYGQLGELVAASTRAMMAAGVGPGDRVAIWAPNGLGWIVAALGAQCAGAALYRKDTCDFCARGRTESVPAACREARLLVDQQTATPYQADA